MLTDDTSLLLRSWVLSPRPRNGAPRDSSRTHRGRAGLSVGNCDTWPSETFGSEAIRERKERQEFRRGMAMDKVVLAHVSIGTSLFRHGNVLPLSCTHVREQDETSCPWWQRREHVRHTHVKSQVMHEKSASGLGPPCLQGGRRGQRQRCRSGDSHFLRPT